MKQYLNWLRLATVIAIPILGWHYDYFWWSLLACWFVGLLVVEVVPRDPKDYGTAPWVWMKILWPLLCMVGFVMLLTGHATINHPKRPTPQPTPVNPILPSESGPKKKNKVKPQYRSIDDDWKGST